MIAVVTPAEMAAVDASAPEPFEVLVERAGAAVARTAVRLLGGTYGKTVAIVCGPGNNGLDGRVAARLLAARGVRVRVIDVADQPASLPAVDLVIDAAFGTGYRVGDRPPYEFPTTGSPVLAVDIPSGIDGLTGAKLGAPARATATITFQALKPGLLFGDGPAWSGAIEVVDIGLAAGVEERARAHLVTRDDVAGWWPQRSVEAHKWNHAVRLIAGSAEMPGAAALAAAAAMRAGSGYVALTTPGARPADVVAAGCPVEAVQRPAPAAQWAASVLEEIDRFRALLVGPGLGRSAETAAAVRAVTEHATIPLVLDGDALHAVAEVPSVVASRSAPTVLTPHDGEFARLTRAIDESTGDSIDVPTDGSTGGASATAVDTARAEASSGDVRDRISAAHRVASAMRSIVLLKGPTTIVADGTRALLIDHGDQRLATAGSGDVLAGMIAAACAFPFRDLAAVDRVGLLERVAAAAWLHAEAGHCAGELLAGGRRRLRGAGLDGIVASDLVEALPLALSGAAFDDRR